MVAKIHRFTSLSSTNRTALKLAEEGAEHGEVVLAEFQTEGRGRLGRSWHSPQGKGLYFSLILRPCGLALAEYSRITLMTGIAVAEVLALRYGVQAMLKWPNDIYLSGKKCCGILAESAAPQKGNVPYVIVGVGINVNTMQADLPSELVDRVTSLAVEMNKEISDRDLLLHDLCKAILQELELLQQGCFTDILKRWKLRDFLLGKKLRWVTHGGEIVEGISQGPADDGCLIICDKDGRCHSVMSGDLSLASSR